MSFNELSKRNVEPSPMVDNFEINSTASSEISDSLRNQILGRPYQRRTRTRPHQKSFTNPILLRKSDTIQDLKAEGDNKSVGKELSFHTPPRASLGSIEKGKQSGSSQKELSNHTQQVGSVEATNEKELSYHTARGGSVEGTSQKELSYHTPAPQTPSQKSAKSIQDIPSNKGLNPSMSNLNQNRYTTIETQTVAIQTVHEGTDPDLECRCKYGDFHCDCPQCEPNNCRFGYSKKPEKIPSETSENYTESSSQTVTYKPRKKRCSCTCGSWDDFEPSMTEAFTDSDESCTTTDFFDLPYQNNEDYMKMLRELERKLIARNRDRVRRTMMEFERRSRMNQNLEKPVCEYEGESILEQLSPKKTQPICCKKCGRNKRINSDILQNEKRWDEMEDSGLPLDRCFRRSHWQLDPRKGEWVKVACQQQNERKDCCCRQKKRR